MKKHIIFLFLVSLIFKGFAQQTPVYYVTPFLDITTNSRIIGFGEVGVVSSPFYKNTGVYQNPALISNYSHSAGVNFTYEPPKFKNKTQRVAHKIKVTLSILKKTKTQKQKTPTNN